MSQPKTKTQKVSETVARDEDHFPDGRSQYDVSYSELIKRNFIAGMSRGAGWFIFQFVIIVFFGAIVINYLVPALSSVTSAIDTTNEIFSSAQTNIQNSWLLNPKDNARSGLINGVLNTLGL